MKLYQLKYLWKVDFKDTNFNYYVIIEDDDVFNQFIHDEEQRTSYHVYLEPCSKGTHELILFNRIPVSTPDGGEHTVPIFIDKEDDLDEFN